MKTACFLSDLLLSCHRGFLWQGSPGEAGMPGSKGSKVSGPILFPLKPVYIPLSLSPVIMIDRKLSSDCLCVCVALGRDGR